MLEASPKNEHSPMRLLAKCISVHAQNEQPLPHLGSTLKCSANVESTPVVEHTTVHRSDDSGTEGEDRACVPNMDVLNHKLYGRANEHHQLMQAYQTATWRALVLITGDKGSGKTSLAYSLKERVRGDFGYMVSGTWESFARDPFKPFLDLCNNFINQVCDGGEEAVASIRGIMQDLVREEGSITFDLYPGLRRVIGDEDASESGRCGRLSARFCPTRAFRTFMRAFGVSKPVVIVFDNLDSADQCALDLINKIAPSATNNGCLIVCTCRSGLASSSIVSQMLRQLESDNVEINSIHVPNLKTESVNEMLSDILRVPEDKCQSLAKIVVEKTLGNAAYTISWIRALVKGEQLHHDERNQVWLWEKEAIEISMTYPHACALFSRTMDEHPQQLKELLKVASCLGTQLDNRILSVALSVQDVHHYLEMGVDRGALLFDDVANGFAFIHSGARDGAYDLIKEEDRKEFHLAIGRKLWKGLTQEELQLHMFLVVNQLKFGKGLVKYNEKLALAALCLQAGERSMMTADFQSASQVLSLGLQCLGPDSFREDYNLSLTLHNVAAEAFYACGDVVALETTVDAVVGNARTFRDKVRAYSTKILSLGSRDKAHEAIQVGLCVLEQLGEPMPMRPGSIVVEFKKIQRMLRSKTDEMLLRLPEMSVVDKTSSMHILNLMFLNAYLWETTLSVHISLRMVRLSLQYGLSAVSSFGFATYGMLLCGASKDLDAGFRFGQLAIKILEKFGARSWVPRVYAIVYGCLHSFKLPIRDSLAPLKEAYTVGIGTGDFEYAFMNANLYIFNATDICSLVVLNRECKVFNKMMERHNHELSLAMNTRYCQMIQVLMGLKDYSTLICGDTEKDKAVDPILARDDMCVAIVWYERMICAIAFRDMTSAELFARGCLVKLTSNPLASFEKVQVEFFASLVFADIVRTSTQRSQRLQGMKVLRRTIKRLRKWAEDSPENCFGKLFLLEAELATLTGKHKQALGKFACAIAFISSQHCLLELAISQERAGRYRLRTSDTAPGILHLERAYETYMLWGAAGAGRHLRDELDLLLEVKPFAAQMISSVN